jgi:hypothetical protein
MMQKIHHERLHGYRRYDPKDGGGRIASGTAIESNAGAVAESTKKNQSKNFVSSW